MGGRIRVGFERESLELAFWRHFQIRELEEVDSLFDCFGRGWNGRGLVGGAGERQVLMRTYYCCLLGG